LRGRFATVAIAGCLGGCQVTELAVWDLWTGVRLWLVTPRRGDLMRVMLSRRGALAYVTEELTRVEKITRVRVVKVDARGHRVVKRGSSRDLPLSSVRLRGSRLSSKFKGERQSVRLR